MSPGGNDRAEDGYRFRVSEISGGHSSTTVRSRDREMLPGGEAEDVAKESWYSKNVWLGRQKVSEAIEIALLS
jgi:hypothetical protein